MCHAMPDVQSTLLDPCKTLSAEEVRLATMWYKEDNMEPSEVASLLRRDKSTMARLLVMQKAMYVARGGQRLWTCTST